MRRTLRRAGKIRNGRMRPCKFLSEDQIQLVAQLRVSSFREAGSPNRTRISRLRDGGGVQIVGRIAGVDCAALPATVSRRTQFRNHIGVENDHSSNVSGPRPAITRNDRQLNLPPKGFILRRIASTRCMPDGFSAASERPRLVTVIVPPCSSISSSSREALRLELVVAPMTRDLPYIHAYHSNVVI